MKNTISFLLCIIILLGLAACDAKDTKKESNSAVVKPSIIANDATNPDSGDKPAIIANDATNPDSGDKPAIIANNVTDSADMMEVDSPVGTLYYPEKWKDDVVFQVNGDQLVALYHDIPIFTLYFGGEKGILYGTVNHDGVDTELRYEMHDLDSEREDYETMSAMQDDINVIFYYLTEGK